MGLADRVVPSGRGARRGGRPGPRHRLPPPGRAAQRPALVLRAVVAGLPEALANEFRHGMETLQTGELFGGLDDYASGAWRT